MSHKLFRHSILCDARVWNFLKQADAAEAESCREAGCPRCGGALHSATYPRKPNGLAAELRDDVRCFSLCCSVCRRRVKPASVRFFGWRFYVGALFVVVSALAVGGGVRLQTVAWRCGIAASGFDTYDRFPASLAQRSESRATWPALGRRGIVGRAGSGFTGCTVRGRGSQAAIAGGHRGGRSVARVGERRPTRLRVCGTLAV